MKSVEGCLQGNKKTLLGYLDPGFLKSGETWDPFNCKTNSTDPLITDLFYENNQIIRLII